MKADVLAEGLGFTEGPVLVPDGRVAVQALIRIRL